VDATCYRDRSSFDPGTDLAAYLIERGWALARPEAPFEYHAMERIARSQEVGVWGWQVDSVTIPRR
jgi:endonuclease YncB( thermonuclease family)